MKLQKLRTYVIHYRTSENSKFFVQTIKACKRPETTKEYKRLHNMLYQDLIQACGYCEISYYKENINLFIYSSIN